MIGRWIIVRLKRSMFSAVRSIMGRLVTSKINKIWRKCAKLFRRNHRQSLVAYFYCRALMLLRYIYIFSKHCNYVVGNTYSFKVPSSSCRSTSTNIVLFCNFRYFALQCADNVLLIHAFNECLLFSKDDVSDITDTSENLLIEKANISCYYLVLFEKEKDSLTRFASSEICYHIVIMRIILSPQFICSIFRLRMWLINIVVVDFEGLGTSCFCEMIHLKK